MLRCLAAVLLSSAAGGAFAAHPLQTEDTGTQGIGNLELENGFARARTGAATVFGWQPQLSGGVAPTVDAIVQPSFVAARAAGGSTVSGAGDTNLDAKWRFFGVDPISLAVRAGLELPTGERGLGLPHGRLGEHALLVATWDAAPTTVHANVGLAHVPPAPGTRATVALVSAAVMQQLGERLILTLDAQANQDPDPARRAWPGNMLAGAIGTLRPGLDVDVGYQASVHARPPGRQWLAGITWRFSP